jgi:hypothetical protein
MKTKLIKDQIVKKAEKNYKECEQDEDDLFRDVIRFNKRKNKSVIKMSFKDKLSKKSQSS